MRIKDILLYTVDLFYLGPTPQLLTPFPLNRPSQTDSTAISSTLTTQKSQLSPMCKEESSLVVSNPLNTSVSPLSGSQLVPLIIDTSDPQTPSGSTISPSSDPMSLQRDGVSMPFTDHTLRHNGSSVIHSALSSSVNMYDNPPPSYWRNENDGKSGHRSSGTVTPKPS